MWEQGNFGPYEKDTEAPVLFRGPNGPCPFASPRLERNPEQRNPEVRNPEVRAGTYYALLSDINVYAFGVTSPVTAYISHGTPLVPVTTFCPQPEETISSNMPGNGYLGSRRPRP